MTSDSKSYMFFVDIGFVQNVARSRVEGVVRAFLIDRICLCRVLGHSGILSGSVGGRADEVYEVKSVGENGWKTPFQNDND